MSKKFKRSKKMVDMVLEYDKSYIIPNNKGKTLLVDADSILITSLLRGQYTKYIDIDNLKKKKRKKLANSPYYNFRDREIIKMDMKVAKTSLKEKLDRLLIISGCSKIKLFLTGSNVFRYKVDLSYKARRKESNPKPPKLDKLKEWVIKHYDVEIEDILEADDLIVYFKNKNPKGTILASIDKDVIYSTIGTHLNFYEINTAKVKRTMTWVKVTENMVNFLPYLQAIIGDNVDSIKGIPKYGVKKAVKTLDLDSYFLDYQNLTLIQVLEIIGQKEIPFLGDFVYFNKLVNEFEANNLDIAEVYKQLNLVDMHLVGSRENIGTFKHTEHLASNRSYIVYKYSPEYATLYKELHNE